MSNEIYPMTREAKKHMKEIDEESTTALDQLSGAVATMFMIFLGVFLTCLTIATIVGTSVLIYRVTMGIFHP